MFSSADDRGDLVRARDDRGVRRLAAGIGDEPGDRGLVQLRGVGRRQVVRDDDRVGRRLRAARCRGRAGCAARARTRTRRRCARSRRYGSSMLSNTRADVVDRAAQRPLGVDLLVADVLDRGADEVLVVEHHLVRGDDVVVALVLRRELLLDLRELLVARRDRLVEPRDLGVDVVGFDVMARRLERVAADQVRAAERDARRRRRGRVRRISWRARSLTLTCPRRTCRRSARRSRRSPRRPVALRAQRHRRALARDQHEHAHDALAVDLVAVLRQRDLARILRRELDELGRGARVQPELVLDLDRLLAPSAAITRPARRRDDAPGCPSRRRAAGAAPRRPRPSDAGHRCSRRRS